MKTMPTTMKVTVILNTTDEIKHKDFDVEIEYANGNITIFSTKLIEWVKNQTNRLSDTFTVITPYKKGIVSLP